MQVSREITEKIICLSRSGLNRDAIAHRLGVGRSSCSKVIRAARDDGRLPSAPAGEPPIAQTIRDAIFRLRHGEKLYFDRIAERLDISVSAATKYYRIECERRGETPIKTLPKRGKKTTKRRSDGVTKPRRKRGYHAGCRCCNGEVSFPVDMELDISKRLSIASGSCDLCDQFYWLKDLLDIEALMMAD